MVVVVVLEWILIFLAFRSLHLTIVQLWFMNSEYKISACMDTFSFPKIPCCINFKIYFEMKHVGYLHKKTNVFFLYIEV